MNQLFIVHVFRLSSDRISVLRTPPTIPTSFGCTPSKESPPVTPAFCCWGTDTHSRNKNNTHSDQFEGQKSWKWSYELFLFSWKFIFLNDLKKSLRIKKVFSIHYLQRRTLLPLPVWQNCFLMSDTSRREMQQHRCKQQQTLWQCFNPTELAPTQSYYFTFILCHRFWRIRAFLITVFLEMQQ